MACAERHLPSRSRHTVHVKKKKAGNGVCGAAGKGGAAHVKKEKARNNVCGAAPAIPKAPHSTRQKEKAGNGVCGAAGKGGAAHVKKKKAGNGVCGAAPAIPEPLQKGNQHTPPPKNPQQ